MPHLVHAPHLNRDVVIGACKLPDPHAMRIHLGDYVDLNTLPPAKANCDYSAPAMSVISNIEGNDSVGDCVLAEEAHFVGVMTGNTNRLFSYTAAMTLAVYSAITGYNPADPSTDQGADPTVAMNYFTKNAYADGTKLAGWAMVDASNQQLVQFAIEAFGNLKLWVGLPNVWISPFPSKNGFVWDLAPANSNNGHCIGSCGYNSTLVTIVGSNSQGVQVMTWGLIGTITWRAFAALFVTSAGGGAAVRITPDWLANGATNTPSGFAYADLASDFNKFYGGNIPVPAPTPQQLPANLANAKLVTNATLAQQLPFIKRGNAQSLVDAALATLVWP
jgi:hypothetical protein